MRAGAVGAPALRAPRLMPGVDGRFSFLVKI
jgi:hypothetical protein